MSDRKRVNMSVDPDTYNRLMKLKKDYGFTNVCEMVVALVHILLDRKGDSDQRQYDIPEGDGEYIDQMFDELGHVHKTPDGTVPKRRNTRGYGKG